MGNSLVCERRPTKNLAMAETLQLRGTLEGHSGWVTQIATNPKYPDIILSASRDKTLIVWKLTRDEQNYGVPQKAPSWTRTLRLRRCLVFRWTFRLVRILGQELEIVGFVCRLIHPAF